MKQLIMIVAALAALSTVEVAHAGHVHAKKAVKVAALICPVTGDKIASVKAAVGHSMYKGKTYYFCCPECKPRFDKDPAKIVKNAGKGKYEKM